MRRVRFIAAPVLFGVLVTSSPTFAQDVSIVPRLRAGDAFQLEVIRIRENSAQPQQNSKSTSRVDVRVISASADGFVIEWVPGDTVFDNPQAAPDPLVGFALQAAPDLLVGVASQALRDIRFRLNLNADGELQGLANQAEVAPKLKTMLDVIVRRISERLPEDQRKEFVDFLGQFLSVDVLVGIATRDADTYLGLNGVSLAAGEAVEVDLEQPNPFGGDPIPARFGVRMVSASAETASLKTTTTYDAASLLHMTESLAKKAGASLAPEDLAKLPPIAMADEGTFVFDRRAGLMREVKVNRRMAVGPNRRLEAWEIRLVSGPR